MKSMSLGVRYQTRCHRSLQFKLWCDLSKQSRFKSMIVDPKLNTGILSAMLLLTKPSAKFIDQFIHEQQSLAFSYSAVGLTKEGLCPPGYGTDTVVQKLGSGAETFALAKAAFKHWTQFKVGWVEVYPADIPILAGSALAVLAQHFCFWSINACRIVYTIDDEGPIVRFGFAYGTLPDHAEAGEERFLLEWDKTTDIVTYKILAFSNPNTVLGWLAYPMVRHIQNSFRRDSIRLLKQQITSLT